MYDTKIQSLHVDNDRMLTAQVIVTRSQLSHAAASFVVTMPQWLRGGNSDSYTVYQKDEQQFVIQRRG